MLIGLVGLGWLALARFQLNNVYWYTLFQLEDSSAKCMYIRYKTVTALVIMHQKKANLLSLHAL